MRTDSKIQTPAMGFRRTLLILCSVLFLSAGALATTLSDSQGNVINRAIVGASGGLLTAGSLQMESAAGQAAAGFSTFGSFELTHGALAALEAEGEGEGEGDPEGEGEGAPDECVSTGAPVSAIEGAGVCLSLPAACDVDPVDPMYQWFKDGDATALTDIPGVRTGVNSPELCFVAVELDDAGLYTLFYESEDKATNQYSVTLLVQPSTGLPLGSLSLLMLTTLLLAFSAVFMLHRRESALKPVTTKSAGN